MEQNQMLVQLSTSEFLKLVKVAVKDELQNITKGVHVKQNELEKKNDLLSRNQTAELLGVSTTTLFLWNRDKILEHKKIGSRVYYLKSEVLNKIKTI